MKQTKRGTPDRRQYNVPPNARTPAKADEDRSRPYQFRLNPTDSEDERNLRDFILQKQSEGVTLRELVLDMYKSYIGKQQPAEIEREDYHQMHDAILWIVEQIETGALSQSKPISGKKPAKVVVPDSLNGLFARLTSKGASAHTLQIDDDE
jgi:hypothetical protein